MTSVGDGGDGGFNIAGSKSGILEKSIKSYDWPDELTELGWSAEGPGSRYRDQSLLARSVDSDDCDETGVGNDGGDTVTLGCADCDGMPRMCNIWS